MKQEQDLFPHGGFPIRLEYQDGKDYRICWFQSQNHLDKHVTRYKINLNEAKLKYEENAQFKRLIQRLRGLTKAAGRARTAQGATSTTANI